LRLKRELLFIILVSQLKLNGAPIVLLVAADAEWRDVASDARRSMGMTPYGEFFEQKMKAREKRESVIFFTAVGV
jgi:hypothetical protein